MAVNENAELEELIRNATGGGISTPTTEAEPTDEGGGLDFDTLLLVARRSLLWLLLLIGLGLTGSWLFLRYTKPVYRSSSVLKIDEKAEAAAVGLGGAVGASMDSRQSINKLSGEVELIKSNIIYRRLRDSLDLNVNYYVEGTVLESELYGTSPFRVEYQGDILYNNKFNLKFTSVKQFQLSYLLGGQEQSSEHTLNQPFKIGAMTLLIRPTPLFKPEILDRRFHFVINDEGAINGYLDRNLLVEIVNPSASTIQISFQEFNPAKARAIVYRIDTVYLQEKLVQKREGSANSLRFLDQQLSENFQNLQRAEESRESFVRRTKTYDVRSSVTELRGKTEKLEEERLKLAEKLQLLTDLAGMVERGSLASR
ncbi:MAG: hypothetical protein H7Z21_06240, partial [Hymenobacter sp.]|nr:hypothetical protein [Hymenobacter sp.]